MKVRIVLDKSRCVANQACLRAGSEFIQVRGDKIHVDQARQREGKWICEVEVDQRQLEELKEAATLCPTNVIEIRDADTGEELVKTTISAKQDVQPVRAEYDDAKEFVLDPKGYFLIKTIPQTKEIEIAFCEKPNEISAIVVGKRPIDIYFTFFNKLGGQFISRFDHAAYLGRELQKAYTALRLGIPYVQDDELDLDAAKQ